MPQEDARRNFLLEGHTPSKQPWIVPSLLRARSLAMFSAPPNSLKTWSALDLARAATTGGAWLGFGPVAQSAVMLVLLDSTIGDSASQFRRLTQEFADGGRENRDLIQDLVFRYNADPGSIDLAQTESRDEIIEAANGFVHLTRTWPGGTAPKDDDPYPELDGDGEPTGYLCLRSEGRPEHDYEGELITPVSLNRDPAHEGVQIIIFDSLSKISSAQESVAEEMGIVTANLRIIAEKTGALVLVLHHERKAPVARGQKSTSMDMVRGSSVIAASFETILSFEPRDPKEPLVRISVTKQRGAKLPPWNVLLEVDGDPERDNEHALAAWATFESELHDYNTDETVPYSDPDGDQAPEFNVERLYPSEVPYARARLVNLAGAAPELAPFLRFVVGAGGSVTLEEATQWVVEAGIITNTDDPADKWKAAKKWVTNRALQARKDGWLLPAAQDARGLYVASDRATKHYAGADDVACERLAERLTSALAKRQ